MTENFQYVSFSVRGSAALTGVGAQGAERTVDKKFQVVTSLAGPVDVDSAPLSLYGPGDVVGIDPAQIVRRAPRPGDKNMEPNYLAVIEFADPALPWLFTADAPNDVPTPWIMLIVVPDTGAGTVRPLAGAPAPVVSVPRASLHNPDQAGAWAHVQVHEADGPAAQKLLAAPDPGWSRVRSRVVAPTRLQPDTAYVACVVPVFEAGRLAGLGLPVGNAGSSKWKADQDQTLPVYDSWRFRTGPAGDFESLARRLRGVTNFDGIGERAVAVDAAAARMQPAGGPLPLFPPAVRQVPTAIGFRDAQGHLTPGDDTDAQRDLRPKLKELVNRTVTQADDDPVVGPPIYGQWPAEVLSVDGAPADPAIVAPPAGSQRWIAELNLDPEERLAAGVATLVAQRGQEEFMRRAWDQLETVLDANRRVRWSQLFAATSGILHARLAAVPSIPALRVAAPALTRLADPSDPAGRRTLAATVSESTVAPSMLGAEFARATRLVGPAALATTGVNGVVQSVVEGVSAGAAAFVPARFNTPRTVDHARLASVLDQAGLGPAILANTGARIVDHLTAIEQVRSAVDEQATLVTQALRVAPVPAAVPVAVPVGVPGPPGGETGRIAVRLDPGIQAGIGVAARGLIADQHPILQTVRPAVLAEFHAAAQAPPQVMSVRAVRVLNQVRGPLVDLAAAKVFVSTDAIAQNARVSAQLTGLSAQDATKFSVTKAVEATVLTKLGIDATHVVAIDDGLSAADETVAAAASAALRQIAAVQLPRQFPAVTALSSSTIAAAVTRLEPQANYTRMLGWAHQFDALHPSFPRRRSPLHPIMACPVFDDPVVDRLKAYDQDWVLGGSGKLPPNSVCVLAVNRLFVESFLVGMNHEMARELRWRGYPTDMKGSCFKRFWPTPPGAVNPPEDIAPINTWDQPLGNNEAPGQAVVGMSMVVVRGDLLRRYPNTIIAAEQGTVEAGAGAEAKFTSKRRVDELFTGTLAPDITYVALGIDIDELRDETNGKWYITFHQPLDEPRFGLDEIDPDKPSARPPDPSRPDTWAWDSFGNPAELDASMFPHPSSDGVAADLYRRPFELLMHAVDYMPPKAS